MLLCLLLWIQPKKPRLKHNKCKIFKDLGFSPCKNLAILPHLVSCARCRMSWEVLNVPLNIQCTFTFQLPQEPQLQLRSALCLRIVTFYPWTATGSTLTTTPMMWRGSTSGGISCWSMSWSSAPGTLVASGRASSWPTREGQVILVLKFVMQTQENCKSPLKSIGLDPEG